MKSCFKTRRLVQLGAALALSTAFATAAFAAGPQVVAGPGAEPECFKPVSADTKYFQWPAKKGPYRIALVNGFIANDWRVQMIKVAKAYANQPSVKSDLKDFKVGSVGQDGRVGATVGTLIRRARPPWRAGRASGRGRRSARRRRPCAPARAGNPRRCPERRSAA